MGTESNKKEGLLMLEQFRHDLHQIPELGLDTQKTADYIVSVLQELDCSISMPLPNAIIAYFDFGKEETMAFRSDMDALPIHEQNAFSFRSKNGCMHACGHDGHMSMLLGLAQKISGRKDMKYNVLLIFQPGEEDPGGAQLLCDAGIFGPYDIKGLFGFHIYPNRKTGEIVSCPGVMMAGACNLKVSVVGEASHAAMRECGHDALLAAAQVVSRCSKREQEMFDEDTFHLLHFGVFESGDAFNVVANKAVLKGTIRYFDPKVFDAIIEMLEEEFEMAEVQYGVSFSCQIDQHYPPLENDERLLEKVKGAAEVGLLEQPVLIAEDFAFYAKQVPAVFFFIGSGMDRPLHSDTFDFDEALLSKGVSFYEKLLDNM